MLLSTLPEDFFLSICPSAFLLYSFAVSQGDIVLLGMRDYQEDKVDIIHKYNADEARNLKAFGELPETGTCLLFLMSGLDFCVLSLGDGQRKAWFQALITSTRPPSFLSPSPLLLF